MEHTLERSCMLHGSAQRRGIPVDTLCDHFNPKRGTASQQAVHTAAPEERLPHSLNREFWRVDDLHHRGNGQGVLTATGSKPSGIAASTVPPKIEFWFLGSI